VFDPPAFKNLVSFIAHKLKKTNKSYVSIAFWFLKIWQKLIQEISLFRFHPVFKSPILKTGVIKHALGPLMDEKDVASHITEITRITIQN